MKKWWHFQQPREFYSCYVLGSGPPTKKHISRSDARREAARLAATKGLPVYVLRTVEIALPQQPAPHPGIDVYGYDVGHYVGCFGVTPP
jgi:hypothetical protein